MIDDTPLPTIHTLSRRIASAAQNRAILWPLAEMLLWGALGLAIAFSMLAFRPAPLSNDSFQYLSVAKNIRQGNGIATDLVYFDTERSHGRIPAPLTTFPPGYPAVIAALSGLMGGFEAAARFLSVISALPAQPVLLAFVLMAARVTALVRAAIESPPNG